MDHVGPLYILALSEALEQPQEIGRMSESKTLQELQRILRGPLVSNKAKAEIKLTIEAEYACGSRIMAAALAYLLNTEDRHRKAMEKIEHILAKEATMTKIDLTKLRELAEKAIETQAKSSDCLAVEYHQFTNEAVRASSALMAAANPATIIALLDRIGELEKALKPFADEVELKRTMKLMPDAQKFIGFSFTVGDLRRAAATLPKAKP